MAPAPRRCPAAGPDGPACAAEGAASLPREGAERVAMLALRFVAAAAETGDAACFDAAFDGAEAALGPAEGAVLVARAAALVRALRREGAGVRFLPPPCRRLSPGEAMLLAALRRRAGGRGEAPEAGLPGAARAALAALAAPIRDGGPPPAAAQFSAVQICALDRF